MSRSKTRQREKKKRSTPKLQRSTPNVQFKHQTSNFLEPDFEELDPFPFPRVRVEDNALCGRAVLSGRVGVEHLERVAATGGARDDSLDVFPVNRRRRRWFSCRAFSPDRCDQGWRRGYGGERRHD